MSTLNSFLKQYKIDVDVWYYNNEECSEFLFKVNEDFTMTEIERDKNHINQTTIAHYPNYAFYSDWVGIEYDYKFRVATAKQLKSFFKYLDVL